MAPSKRASGRQQAAARDKNFEPMEELLSLPQEGQVAGLQELAGVQQQRAERLDQAARRLTESLGAEHPRVVALNRKAAQAEQLAIAAEMPVKRTHQIPPVGPNNWLISGHVTLSSGQPAVGWQVFLAANNKPVEGVKPAKINDSGDFNLVVTPAALKPRAGERATDLFLQVADPKGAVQFTSEIPLNPAAGKIDYFEITLAAK